MSRGGADQARVREGRGPKRSRIKAQASSEASDSWLRITGVWCVAGKLLLVPVTIDPLGADPFALPKSAISRALLYVLCVLAALYVVRRRPALRPTSLAICAASVVVATALSTLFAIDPVSALYGGHRRGLGLTSVLDGAALAGAMLIFMRTRRDLIVVAGTASVALATVTGYGLLQLFGMDPISWPETRLASLLGNSTTLAGYLVIVSTMLLTASLILWTQLSRAVRVSALALIASALLLAIATGARTPTLAIVPSIFFAVAVARRAGWHPPSVSRNVVFIGLAAVLVGSTVFILSTGAERLGRLAAGRDDSAIERGFIYDAALRSILARPLLGVGPDGMGAVYPALRQPETSKYVILAPTHTSTHSWVIHWLLGTGMIGLAAFLALVGVVVRRGWARASTPEGIAGAVGVVGIVTYLAQGLLTVNSVVTEMLLWTSIGLIAIPTIAMHGNGDVGGVRRRRVADAIPAAVALTAGLALALFGLNLLEANRAVHASNLARSRGAFAAAERAAQDAVHRDPRRADPWNVLGLAYSRRQPERAITAFSRAVAQAPRDPVYMINLAAEEAFASVREPSRKESAALHASRALELDPNGIETARRASEVFAVVGQPDRALQIALRVRELTPTDLSLRQWLADLYTDAGRPREAIAEVEAIIQLDPVQSSQPRLALPPERRLPLAGLYRRIGDLARARELTRPPVVVDGDASCVPKNGSKLTVSGVVRPRCIRIVFSSEEPLVSDAADLTAASSPANYLINGVAVPPGSVIEHSGLIATIQLPADIVPPPSGVGLTVRSVANTLGQRLAPDPTEFRLR